MTNTRDDKLDPLSYADLLRSAGFTRLFTCFRIAMHPARLGLALLLIITAYAGGRALDAMWGKQVVPNEFAVWTSGDVHKLSPKLADPTHGVFDATLETTLTTFEKGVQAVVRFDFGFHQLAPGATPDDTTIIGACRTLFIAVPMWLFQAHPGFAATYALVLLLLWSLLGGAISRQAMVDATTGQSITAGESISFVWHRWGRYIVTPVLPLLIVAVIGLLLALAGLLTRVPGLNVIVGLFMVLALALAFVMALLLIGWFGGVHLIYPGLSAEGTDALEVMGRAFSYVLARPWRLLFYSFVALIYGTITYLFVGLFIYIMFNVAHLAMGAWAGEGFEGLFPEPTFGHMRYELDDQVEGTYKATAVLVAVWLYILIGVLGAYAISFYFAASTQIYLLLRRWTDGTDFAEVYVEHAGKGGAVRDKVEPAKAAESDKIEKSNEAEQSDKAAASDSDKPTD